jgi:hypothetical protein
MTFIQALVDHQCELMGFPLTQVSIKPDDTTKRYDLTFSSGDEVMRLHNIDWADRGRFASYVTNALTSWHKELLTEL